MSARIGINGFGGMGRLALRAAWGWPELAFADKAAMNVGFYYMANAGGRLVGTVLSGLLYEWDGLEACLWFSVACVLTAAVLSTLLPATPRRARPDELALAS